jgi:hypothetical protein
MNQHANAFKVKQEVFAPSADTAKPSAPERIWQRHRHRPSQGWISHKGINQLIPLKETDKAPAGGFYFRQFRHFCAAVTYT